MRSPNRNPIREMDVPYGASGANVAYALIAQRHMQQFGTTSRQLAKAVVDQRHNAQLNPQAIFHGVPLTVEEVLASPLVADPLHLLEVVIALWWWCGLYRNQCGSSSRDDSSPSLSRGSRRKSKRIVLLHLHQTSQ